jgi:YidC/Oxa1 family membrane protein insertase
MKVSNMTNPSVDPNAAAQMKSMNIMMPLMSAFFCFSLPSGMGLYWIVGAVVRCIQQSFINKHIDKMDIDAMVARNLEKMKEKEARTGKSSGRAPASSGSVAEKSSVNTRNIKSAKYSTKVSGEAEEKLRDRRSGSGKKYKAGSLAAKVNLVDEFNDIGKK